MNDIEISLHAINQFVKRLEYLDQPPPKNPEGTIRKLLSKAKTEELDPYHRVIRLLNNSVKEAEYFVNSGWRFVVVAGKLVTVERVKPLENKGRKRQNVPSKEGNS